MNILAANTATPTQRAACCADNLQSLKCPSSKVKTSIFYTNDIHGQIPKMERLYSAGIQSQLAAKQTGADFFKLSSGDTFIGSDKGRNMAAAQFIDMSGYDAETLGNHEFDITASICGDLLKNSSVIILGMNSNFPNQTSELSKKVLRSAVIEKPNGEKYGLIGIQPPDMTSRIRDKEVLEGVTIDDKEQTKVELQQEVNQLRAKGINKIILLSHGGNTLEKEIAQSISGIDVILGGHSHDLIRGIKEGENLFYSPEGEPVVITQAGRDGNNFGVLNLEFNDKGQITYVQNNITETNVFSSNLIMKSVIDSILGKSPEIGRLEYVDPLPANNITEENPWADFVSDAVREELGADIVLINSANFRGSVDTGRVTIRDIQSIFPFNNKLFKVRLNEKDLVDAIRACGKTLSAENKKPGIMQVSGLTYALDAAGNLLELMFIDSQGRKNAIDINNPNPNHYFTAIYDEFLVSGGDNLDMLKRSDADIIERYTFDKDVPTVEHIKSLQQPFSVKKDGRIQIIK